MRNNYCYIGILLVVLFSFQGTFAQIESRNIQVGPQKDGSFLVPSNQLLRPAGLQVTLPGRPLDLVQSPDKKLLIVKNRNSIDVIRIQDRAVLQSLSLPKSGNSFTGICLSADGKQVFVTDAENMINVATFAEDGMLKWETPIQLPEPAIGGDAVPGGLALDDRHSQIYVTLSRNNTLGVVNQRTGIVDEIPVGIAPYDVVIISETKAYVSNWGGRRPEEGESTYNTSGSEVLVDPETGIANNGSVSVIDLNTNRNIKSIEVGLHPSGMVASPDGNRLYVACANSDVISVINTLTDEVVEEILVRTEKELPFGSAPNALFVSKDGKTLYVANGTDNAICVIELGQSSRVKGYIPTGWYPASVLLDEESNLLIVANAKGVGSRNQQTGRAGHNSRELQGTVSFISLPDEVKLTQMTETVLENNSYVQKLTVNDKKGSLKKSVPVPQVLNQPSVFKHVVYIIKENRTYDQVFGDMTQGNGDTSLVHFGREITPNHHKLAEEFVLLDNFYCSGVLSADGH
ncbi:MAG: beta-propeller fold lactonase family protein [Draconibacterium sp.]